MSDERDESADLGAADPITRITGAKDDLAAGAVLPDVVEGETEEDGSDAADYALDGPAADAALSQDVVTNDAVAGETVTPGTGDGNDGPTGGAPTEIAPIEPDNELDPRTISLEEH